VVSRAWARSTGQAAASSPALTAGLAVSVLCIWLGFDDMMMVHDAVLPGMGIPEDAALAVYAVLGVVLVAWAFRPLLAERLGITFLVGLALLGGSLGGDVLESLFEGRDERIAQFLGHAEDVVKFLAYAALCHLCVLLARRIMARTLAAATEKAAREAVERAGVRSGASVLTGATTGSGRVPLRVTPGRHAAPTGAVPLPDAPADDLTRPIPRS
jgi:bacterioferritin-associated ferredoxin